MPQSTTELTIPSQLDRAHTALARASTDFERLTIRDQAKVYQAAAEILNRRDIQVQASVLVQRAERAIATANPPLPRGGPPDRGKQSSPTGTIAKLRDMRAVHSKLTDTQFEARTVQAIESETPLTRQSLKASKMPRPGAHDGNDEWYTPANVVGSARSVMGCIDLDPASNWEANETVQAKAIYTVEDDGLTQPWRGRVFLNPPFSAQLKRAFCDRLRESVASGDVTQAVLVTPIDISPQWGDVIRTCASAVALAVGSTPFYGPRGGGGGPGPGFGHMVSYYGPNVGRFASVFDQEWSVWVRPTEH